MEQETWANVANWEGYQVSTLGNVRSFKNGRHGLRDRPKVLKQTLSNRGYLMVFLKEPDKRLTVCVHRLVAEAFIPREEGRNQVDHVDRVRTNNTVSNLRWATHAENMQNVAGRGASQFLGVCRSGNKWMAQISLNGLSKYLGTHSTEEEAARAYDAAALAHYGPRANLNFPTL
jgi:hypothetical protein